MKQGDKVIINCDGINNDIGYLGKKHFSCGIYETTQVSWTVLDEKKNMKYGGSIPEEFITPYELTKDVSKNRWNLLEIEGGTDEKYNRG